MKKLIIIVGILGVAVAAFFGLQFYNRSKNISQLSTALGESKFVWSALQDASYTGGKLPSTLQDESGRKYEVLRTQMDNQRGHEILAVTRAPVTDHRHIVIYQSGRSEVRSSEKLATQLLEEIKSEEPK